MADEAGRVVGLWGKVELHGGAALFDAPCVHQIDPVGHPHGFFLVVGDEYSSDPQGCVNVFDADLQCFAQLGIDGAEGLV